MEKRKEETYRKAILEKYLLEKKGELSSYFFEPTPGLIKEACIIIYDKRRTREDIKILRSFFKPKREENILSAIEKVDIDKFRPVVKFLKEGSTTPKRHSLELASWLVDFEPRPFIKYIHWNGKEKERMVIIDDDRNLQNPEGENVEERKLAEEKERLEKKKGWRKIKRKWIITIAISVAFGAILMTTPLLKELIFKPAPPIIKNEGCMTWADSVYIKISCDQGPLSKYGNAVKPMDRMELKNMKKVKVNAAYRFFTEDDEPLIWYSKNKDDTYEYFTAPGYHPISGETLRKITPHIIQTYVPIHLDQKDSFVPK